MDVYISRRGAKDVISRVEIDNTSQADIDLVKLFAIAAKKLIKETGKSRKLISRIVDSTILPILPKRVERMVNEYDAKDAELTRTIKIIDQLQADDMCLARTTVFTYPESEGFYYGVMAGIAQLNKRDISRHLESIHHHS